MGDLVVPNPANGYVYECSTAGTSGDTAPTFPTGSGATVTDGTAVWTEEQAYPPVISSGTLNFNGSGALTSWTDANNNTYPRHHQHYRNQRQRPGRWRQQPDVQLGPQQQWRAASDPDGGGQQYASPTQDGYSSGTLTDFSINSDGTIEGTFANGTKILGQIALAGFNNEQGLSRQGSDNFAATLASGQAAVGAPGTGGLGSLTGGSLEGSNVDISTEFSNLIIAQREFEANAKSITTFDEIMQDTINLKH